MASQPTSMDGDDEARLVEAAQQDPRCFGELFQRHVHRVYAFIARRVRSRADAEDLTSEVFHLALRNLKKYRWRGRPFAAWLFRIAANAIAQRGRAAARESVVPLQDFELVTDEDSEPQALLFQLVAKLPEDQGRVIALRYAGQKSMREIAAELGRTEAAAKQLHYRALENLRKHLEGQNE